MKEVYYSEEILIDKVQTGEFSMVDYINRHSPAMKEEYVGYCRKKGIGMTEESAEDFLSMKDEEMENAMAEGNL